MLSRELLLKPHLPIEKVPTPELAADGFVFVKTLSSAQRDAFEAEQLAIKSAGGNSLENFRARLAVRCLCDGQGNRILEDADASALGAQSAAVLDRIFTVAKRLNGLGEDDVQELAKNSSRGLSGDSPSASA
jgi:hypothetical protein